MYTNNFLCQLLTCEKVKTNFSHDFGTSLRASFVAVLLFALCAKLVYLSPIAPGWHMRQVFAS